MAKLGYLKCLSKRIAGFYLRLRKMTNRPRNMAMTATLQGRFKREFMYPYSI